MRLRATGLAVVLVWGGLAGPDLVLAQRPMDPVHYAGFSGQVRGVVKGVADDGIWLQVGRVLKVWEGNRAEEPGSLAGQLVAVGPGEGEEDRTRLHRAFLRKIQPGTEMTLEVGNPDGRGFQILELTEDQRARARAREAEPEREGQRMERAAQMERMLHEREMLIGVLREEMRHLHRENAELRDHVERMERELRGREP